MRTKKIILFSFFIILSVASFCQKKINVYAFVAEECPISIFMASHLKAAAEKYGDKINFYLVFPFTTSTKKSALVFQSENKLKQFIIKMDAEQAITKKYGAKVTPEVVITNANNQVVYKGRINDAYLQPGKRRHVYNGNDLDVALGNIVSGNEVPAPWRKAVGCLITIKK